MGEAPVQVEIEILTRPERNSTGLYTRGEASVTP